MRLYYPRSVRVRVSLFIAHGCDPCCMPCALSIGVQPVPPVVFWWCAVPCVCALSRVTLPFFLFRGRERVHRAVYWVDNGPGQFFGYYTINSSTRQLTRVLITHLVQ